MKVLVTGGAGFIGSHLLQELVKRTSHHLIVLDSLTYAGDLENIPESIRTSDQFEFWYGSILNRDLVDFLVGQSDMVVHLAAETHVARSIFYNTQFFETDVLGSQVIANAVLKHRKRIQRLVHVSTSEVYGTSPNRFCMSEDTPLNPRSPYAAAKAGADRMMWSYYTTYNLPIIILRPFNNYGPRQHLEKVIPRFVTHLLRGEPISIHGRGDSCRDYVYVKDTCQAIYLAMTCDSAMDGMVFNVGTGIATSINDLAGMIANHVWLSNPSLPKLMQHTTDRPGQVEYHQAACHLAKTVLGWTPTVELAEGLDCTITWYRDYPKEWVRQLDFREVPIQVDGENIVRQ